MASRTGAARVMVLLAALGLAIFVFGACGDSGDKRDKEQCEVCDPAIDGDCLDECIRFCPAGEDCTSRCQAECDECKRDLRCVECAADCTGTDLRCAPPGAGLSCEDGRF